MTHPSNSEPFEVSEHLVLISIGKNYPEVVRGKKSLYDAVRWAWEVNPEREAERNLVLARYRATVVGAYRPGRWLEATDESFHNLPGWHVPEVLRYGFHGKPAEREVQDKYVRKRVPDRYRLKGAANPIRYCDP